MPLTFTQEEKLKAMNLTPDEEAAVRQIVEALSEESPEKAKATVRYLQAEGFVD